MFNYNGKVIFVQTLLQVPTPKLVVMTKVTFYHSMPEKMPIKNDGESLRESISPR
jgi:hypothetical protein